MVCILKVMHYFWVMSAKTSKKNLKIYQMNIHKIYQINPAKLLSAPGLTWQASLKKTEVKLELLTDINNLLMVEKGIEGGICHAIHHYEKASNKYMKDYDKNKKLSYLKYWNVTNLYGWEMSQRFL